MEEKLRLIEDNNILESRSQTLSFEKEKLKAEIRNINEYIDANTNNLKLRIEELEDLVIQYRNTNSPCQLIELEELVSTLKNKLAEKDKSIQLLNSKIRENIKKSNISFNESEAIAKLCQALKERDVFIMKLKSDKNIKFQEKPIFTNQSGKLYFIYRG